MMTTLNFELLTVWHEYAQNSIRKNFSDEKQLQINKKCIYGTQIKVLSRSKRISQTEIILFCCASFAGAHSGSLKGKLIATKDASFAAEIRSNFSL